MNSFRIHALIKCLDSNRMKRRIAAQYHLTNQFKCDLLTFNHASLMSETEKFALRQAIASSALESNELTEDLERILRDAVMNNMKTEELLLRLADGRA